MPDALVLVGHGSKYSEDDVLPYYVKYFESTGQFSEVRACYLERDPRVENILQEITADRVYVMPLLLAHGYHTKVTIPEALGIRQPHDFVAGKEIHYMEPLGRSEQIATLIRQRIDEAGLKLSH
ncbi:MAG TPA: CbiX/SirB N-terminal domain-containing protein [Methanocellaceae archaeon]